MIEILESKSISVKIFDLFLKSIFWHQGPNLYKHFLILASIPCTTIDQMPSRLDFKREIMILWLKVKFNLIKMMHIHECVQNIQKKKI